MSISVKNAGGGGGCSIKNAREWYCMNGDTETIPSNSFVFEKEKTLSTVNFSGLNYSSSSKLTGMTWAIKGTNKSVGINMQLSSTQLYEAYLGLYSESNGAISKHNFVNLSPYLFGGLSSGDQKAVFVDIDAEHFILLTGNNVPSEAYMLFFSINNTTLSLISATKIGDKLYATGLCGTSILSKDGNYASVLVFHGSTSIYTLEQKIYQINLTDGTVIQKYSTTVATIIDNVAWCPGTLVRLPDYGGDGIILYLLICNLWSSQSAIVSIVHAAVDSNNEFTPSTHCLESYTDSSITLETEHATSHVCKVYDYTNSPSNSSKSDQVYVLGVTSRYHNIFSFYVFDFANIDITSKTKDHITGNTSATQQNFTGNYTIPERNSIYGKFANLLPVVDDLNHTIQFYGYDRNAAIDTNKRKLVSNLIKVVYDEEYFVFTTKLIEKSTYEVPIVTYSSGSYIGYGIVGLNFDAGFYNAISDYHATLSYLIDAIYKRLSVVGKVLVGLTKKALKPGEIKKVLLPK